MNPTKIDWPGLTHTWNPVTGCLRGCKYCYARKNWNRLHRKREGCEFDEIKFYPDRLEEPCIIKKPSKIFVGSMTDWEYWPIWMRDKVRSMIDRCKHHTFMLLSKSPTVFYGLGQNGIFNEMHGLTMTCEEVLTEMQEYKIREIESALRPFVSIEPLIGTLKTDIMGCELVIVGAMTGPGAIKPEREWIESIKRHVPADKIYWKKNIQKFL